MEKEITWTVERIALLKQLWGEGQSAGQIACAMPWTTRSGIIGKAHRLGLDGRPSPIRVRGSGNRPFQIHKSDAVERTAKPKRLPAGNRAIEPPPSAIEKPVKSKEPEPTALVSLEETQSRRGCLWPSGHKPNLLFCGKDRVSLDRPYCAKHTEKAKGKPHEFREKAA